MFDTFTLHCLIDNTTMDAASFKTEHGVAFAIKTPDGQILFDTGQSEDVLVHNAVQMGIDLGRIDALVLSHAHYDHTGGLRTFLKLSQPGLPLYAHPDIFRERFAIKSGNTRCIGINITQNELEQRMALHLSAEPVEVLPRVWTSGEIAPRMEFEGRSPHHYIRVNECWQADPYRDDMALVLEAQSGLIVVCGCCHAGLLNTLAHVRRVFNKEITTIVGGTHLASVDISTLEHAIEVLRATSMGHLPDLYLNHCTGERALATLSQAFGKKVNPFPAGKMLIFD